ncbi:MAG: mitochondrial fission ELM1 family protein, partial [Porticoccaceae bacterium]|nr:mitochondrial fission ELM1 family protein [Porticoccaceae bacterium]
SDGKPGHMNQSLGLARALENLRVATNPTLQVEEPRVVAVLSPLHALAMALSKAAAVRRENPAVLIGAGHRTHLTLLALKRATGAAAVVLMKPSLPLAWFDLCLIPEHDQPPARANVVVTQGAINQMRADTEKDIAGMMLIGGPSDHYCWDDNRLLAAIERIAGAGEPWLLTTSRRTPASFIRRLSALALANVSIVPYGDTAAGWLAQTLPRARTCWVTPDSVSMVYEALTAECRVGIFDLERLRDHRVVKGIDALVARGLVATFSHWRQTGCLPPPAINFNEAQRCAALVYDRLLK